VAALPVVAPLEELLEDLPLEELPDELLVELLDLPLEELVLLEEVLEPELELVPTAPELAPELELELAAAVAARVTVAVTGVPRLVEPLVDVSDTPKLLLLPRFLTGTLISLGETSPSAQVSVPLVGV
jgi:hypothetical protein